MMIGNRPLILCCLFLLLAFLGCKRRQMGLGVADTKITNPYPISNSPQLSQFRGVIKLVIAMPNGNENHCVGTVIAHNLVLTAGHCIVNPRSDRLKRLITIYSSTAQQFSELAEVFIHPTYYQLRMGSDPFVATIKSCAVDVALLRFETPVLAGFPSVPMRETSIDEGEAVYLVGYGYTNAVEKQSFNYQQRVGMNTYEPSFWYGLANKSLDDGVISITGVAYSINGIKPGHQSSPAQSDSGSPLMDVMGNIVGVASAIEFETPKLEAFYAAIINSQIQAFFSALRAEGAVQWGGV